MIRRFFTGRKGSPTAEGRSGRADRRARRRRPVLEALEGRALLSFLGSLQVISLNPQATNNTDNTDSDNASSANGTSVAVWVNAFSATDHDIWAQRFDVAGHPAGFPFSIDFSNADSFHPRVAMDSQGRFVVAWEDFKPNGTSSTWMSYYSASGVSLTGRVLVSDVGLEEDQPDVAASDGSFVITWERFGTGNTDIEAERFVISSGVPHGQGIFAVKSATNLQGDLSVAMAPDGRFDIAYDQPMGFRDGNFDDFDIFASQYDSTGKLLRGNIPINTDTSDEFRPSIAMDAAGNAVIAYHRFVGAGVGIYANRLSSGGTVSGLITVQDAAGTNASEASVALAPTGGRFVVAYAIVRGSVLVHQVKEMASNDTTLATLSPGDVAVDSFSAISVDGLDRFFVTYGGLNILSGHQEIFSRRDFLGGEDLVSALPQTTSNFQPDNASSANGTSVVVWENTNGFTNHDIWAQRYDRLGRPAGAPIAIDTLTTDDSIDPHVAMDSQGRFVVAWENRDPGGTSTVWMRYYSAAGTPLTGITRVTAVGSTNTQPDVAASDGSFVITWTHQVSTTNDDIRAERFVISGGVPQGQGVFAVVADGNIEDAPSVAMSPDGRFDIAYERQWLGADWDIFASQYDGSGALVRGRLFINFDTNPEHNPSIAMDATGNAVVAYQEFFGVHSAIVANRLGSDGSVGPRIFVTTPNEDIDELNPSVALAATGGQFVVAYDTAVLATGISGGVGATEVAADDTVSFNGLPPTVGPFDGNSPAVSIDAFGRYVINYERLNSATNREDVFSRRFFLT
jgi:hypothetical protein